MSESPTLVDSAINELAEKFCQYPNVFLTEDDMRVQLCCILMRDFGQIQTTADGGESIALHTEVRWWGEEHRTDRSDIVIFDVNSINVTDSVVSEEQDLKIIPRKGYSATGIIAAIELKLRRISGPNDNEFRKLVARDVKKLQEIKDTICASAEPTPAFRVIVFDKKSNISESLSDYPPPNFIYKFANDEGR